MPPRRRQTAGSPTAYRRGLRAPLPAACRPGQPGRCRQTRGLRRSRKRYRCWDNACLWRHIVHRTILPLVRWHLLCGCENGTAKQDDCTGTGRCLGLGATSRGWCSMPPNATAGEAAWISKSFQVARTDGRMAETEGGARQQRQQQPLAAVDRRHDRSVHLRAGRSGSSAAVSHGRGSTTSELCPRDMRAAGRAAGKVTPAVPR